MSDNFARRRDALRVAIGDGIAVFAGAAESSRNNDILHPFRQDSDFYSLTGFDEPDAVAVIAADRYVLFVRPRDPDAETWTGPRAGVEGAVSDFGADEAHPLDDLDDELRAALLGRSSLWYRLGGRLDRTVFAALGAARTFAELGWAAAPPTLVDPGHVLHELRLRKTDAELHALRRACAITCDGHVEAMRTARPGRLEYHVQAAMEHVFRDAGSPRNGFPSIVASGRNACVLHYELNRDAIEDGDLVLIDAGAEYGYQSGDVTRTFPASGRFTDAQRRIYEIVLAALEAGIAAAKPGELHRGVDDAARRVIAEGLHDLGLLPRGVDESLRMQHERAFFMHGTSHWLGMDTHDVGAYRIEGKPRALEPGMVLTVEPGIYFASNAVELKLREVDQEARAERRARLGMAKAEELEREEDEAAETITVDVPEEFGGIGIRIEDDVLVTEDGPEVLTPGAPKTIDDVEAACR